MPLGESHCEGADERQNQVGRQCQLGVEAPAARSAQVFGDVHDDGEADGAHGCAQDDGDEHPPVGDVGCQAIGEDDEAGVVEHGDRHEDGIPDGAHGVDAHGEEAGEEHGGEEGLHAERRGDDGFEECRDLSHGTGSRFLGGEHALGEAEVA